MSLIFPKKEILYAPMLGTLGGGSARAFGRGGGGAQVPALDAPLGMFNKSTANNEIIFFDVDHETQYSLGSIPYSTDGMYFDTMKNICWAETTSSTIYGFIPSGSKTGTASDWHRIQGSNISLSNQNGRYGQTFNNRHWNFAVHSSTLGVSIAQGQAQANGTGWNRTNQGNYSSQYYGGSNSNIEDFSLYGDLGFTHGYGWPAVYQLSSTGFTATQRSDPYVQEWFSTFYDNRLGVTYVWPQNTTSITAYGNSYSAGIFNQSTTSVNRTHQFSAGYQNPVYGIYFFPTKGSGSGSGPNFSLHVNDRSGAIRTWNNSGTEQSDYSASLGSGCKCSPVFSYENEAYYVFGEQGVLKLPYTGGGTIGTPSTISYTNSNVRGWRGAAVTSGQMSVWEFDKTKWDY